jgi:hypothetical protein
MKTLRDVVEVVCGTVLLAGLIIMIFVYFTLMVGGQ